MLAHRETGPSALPDKGDVLFVHGWPESSYMWRPALDVVADAGWRGVAPDLVGFGDSELDGPATWTGQVDALEEFRQAQGLDDIVLVVHDWGGLIGLRWACDHPDAVRALLISDTGFFPDGRWHDLANVMRTEGQGEQLVAGLTKEAFADVLRSIGRGFTDEAIEEYFKTFEKGEVKGRASLDLYRSGDFSELEAYDGCLAALGVPTRMLWGADDGFAPVAGGKRFAREIPGSSLVMIEGAGHFLWDDDPERTCTELVAFLGSL